MTTRTDRASNRSESNKNNMENKSDFAVHPLIEALQYVRKDIDLYKAKFSSCKLQVLLGAVKHQFVLPHRGNDAPVPGSLLT